MRTRIGVTVALLAAFVSSARAHVQLEASLDSAQEFPPPSVSAPLPTGTATFTLEEDDRLTYAVNVQNLSGPPVAAHLHRGAPGVAGPIEVALDHNSLTSTTGTISGTTDVLTDAQLTALFDGGLYVNVHTADNGSGEIRGQVRLSKTADTCSCKSASTPKEFKSCVKGKIKAAGKGAREELAALKKTYKKGSCGKTKVAKKAIACCLPQTPEDNIVIGHLCAAVKEKKCTKLGGVSLGEGSTCIPTNPCSPPASASGAFL
jgi:hypothetical protein